MTDPEEKETGDLTLLKSKCEPVTDNIQINTLVFISHSGEN